MTVKAMAPEHPECKNQEPFKSVLENNLEELMKQGEKGWTIADMKNDWKVIYPFELN